MTTARKPRTPRAASPEAARAVCAVCGKGPSVGTAYAAVQALGGRVCGEHARQAIDAGTMVALDRYGVKNFGIDRPAPLRIR